MRVNRIYVEKKSGFDLRARVLHRDIRELLGIKSIERLRMVNRYDVSGIDGEMLKLCKKTVFSEPQSDVVLEELPKADYIFAVEFLPGQFDQRADSCRQCIQFVTGGELPLVKTAVVYLINGVLSEAELGSIKKYLINPVEMREAALEVPESVDFSYEEPQPVNVINDFPRSNADDSELLKFISEYSLAMDVADLSLLAEYFERENRKPTVTELRVVDTYWSDHCRHTTFSTELSEIGIDDVAVQEGWSEYLRVREELKTAKPTDLMDIATIAAKYMKSKGLLKNLDVSDEINACSIKVDVSVNGEMEKWLFFFKNETHNHPTEIEPFGGAATCIGGAIRDPLSGRSYVYQAMRLTGAGNPTVAIKDTIKGKLPQRTIVKTAAKGYSSYGNQIGLATGLVREFYHKGYIAKRMEVGAVVGAAPLENVKRCKPADNDVVLLVGGKTGRDGCGGATGSSKSHNIASLDKCGAEVQKGNPLEERKLQRLFRNARVSSMIKRCNDFGAGGVSVAIGELADGVNIFLDRIIKKYEGLDGTELAISESQERMAVVVSREDMDEFIKAANAENLEATYVADISSENRMVMYWRDKKIVDISRNFLNSNGAKKKTAVYVEKGKDFSARNKANGSIKADYTALVSDLNVCSQKGLVEMFDSTIGAGTVIFPYGGRYRKTPVDIMAARFPVLNASTTTCSMMSYGFNPYISSENCYAGAYLAVLESVSRLIAAGGDFNNIYLSFQEYFESLGTDSSRWGKPVAALIGAFQAQMDMKIAAIGGKDSMSGSFENLDVPPTLISFAVSVADEADIISNEFKEIGNTVFLLSPEYEKNGIPNRKSIYGYLKNIAEIIGSGIVLSASTMGYGGIAESVFKCCIGNGLGFEFEKNADYFSSFDYSYGSFLVEIQEKDREKLLSMAGDSVNISILGSLIKEYELRAFIGGERQAVNIEDLEKAYSMPLARVFVSDLEDENGVQGLSDKDGAGVQKLSCKDDIGVRQLYDKDDGRIQKLSYNREEVKKYSVGFSLAKPRVLIPVFPGTNCEYDTAAAFERAGAEPELLIVKNRTVNDVHSSVAAMKEAVKRANILMLPGGFSGGDEPDGSGKFIIAFLRNPEIAAEIDLLLKKREGLIGGICNGFQALIKLGLLPFGKICEVDESFPTLAENRIGRHQSMLVRTGVCSNKSPWLKSAEIGEVHMVAVSHGEGRFVCNDELLGELIKNGQIATQYVDYNNEPSMDTAFNPNGSVMAVEGITSPDGRIFGKMGHTERMLGGLYRNVRMADTVDSQMFSDAVRYFK